MDWFWTSSLLLAKAGALDDAKPILRAGLTLAGYACVAIGDVDSADWERIRSFTPGPDGSYLLTWYNNAAGVTEQRIVLGDPGAAVRTGGATGESISGGSARDWLDGGAGDDTLTGLADGDRLYGNAGDDTLIGGAGADVLAGGGTGTDTIADFTPGAGAGHDALVISLGTGVTTFAQARGPI